MPSESTRRVFIRRSALAAAGLSVPAALADAVPEGERPPLRFGVIGTGARFRAHVPAIRAAGGMEIVAACDVDEARLQAGAERIGGTVARFRDYRELLARPEVEAVLIATPNLLHEEMLLAALAAGKHVLCEKPMATTPAGLARMREAVEKSSKTVLFGLQLRYAARYTELVKQVRAGRIGAPKLLSFLEYRGDWNDNNVWQYRDPRTGRTMNWRYSRAASGGTLSEKCCHYFDIMNWVADALPTRVSCRGGLSVYRDRETWDHAVTRLEYPGGLSAVHALSMFGPNRLDLQVIGNEGSLQVLESALLFQKRGSRTGEQLPLPKEVDHGERGPERGIETAMLKLYADFRDCVRTGKKPWVTPDGAAASSRIAFFAERSSELGREVRWDERL